MSDGGVERSPAAELTDLLRRLRSDAGVSGADLASRIGTSQATISRYESGRLLPSLLAAGRIGRELRAPATTRRRLLELAQAAIEERSGITPIRVLLQQGVVQLQRRLRMQEARVRHIATFHPSIVPGLLQTEGYLRAIVAGPPRSTPEENDAWVRERLARQMQAAQPGRTGVQIVAEAALHWGVPGAETMAEQCAHLAKVATRWPGWRVGVVPRLPAAATHSLVVPNGFTIYDSESVFLGTTAGNALVTDPRVVADHLELLARVEELAVFGSDAVDLFGSLAERYTADLPGRDS